MVWGLERERERGEEREVREKRRMKKELRRSIALLLQAAAKGSARSSWAPPARGALKLRYRYPRRQGVGAARGVPRPGVDCARSCAASPESASERGEEKCRWFSVEREKSNRTRGNRRRSSAFFFAPRNELPVPRRASRRGPPAPGACRRRRGCFGVCVGGRERERGA